MKHKSQPAPTESVTDRGDRVLYSIGAAARFSGFHPQTLRWYEKQGLVKPIRTRGNARRYTLEDMAQLARIKSLSKRGAGLEAIRVILALEEERRKLYEQVASLERELNRLRSVTKSAMREMSSSERYSPRRKGYRSGQAAADG